MTNTATVGEKDVAYEKLLMKFKERFANATKEDVNIILFTMVFFCIKGVTKCNSSSNATASIRGKF